MFVGPHVTVVCLVFLSTMRLADSKQSMILIKGNILSVFRQGYGGMNKKVLMSSGTN